MSQIPVNEWIVRYRQNPNEPYENGLAYDPDTRRVVFYGGHIGRLYPQSNYTFLYDVAQNRFFLSQALYRPQRRCLVTVDYIDSCRRVLTVNGPTSHGSVFQGVVGGDCKSVQVRAPRGPWLYDTVKDEWEDCRTLERRWESRSHAHIAYEPSSDLLAGLWKDELMLFCPRTNRVVFRPLPDELKDRTYYALAADPVRRLLVLFGGQVAPKQKEDISREEAYEKHYRADTWLYDIANDTWRQAKPKTNPPRGMTLFPMALAMAYHDPSGTMLLLQPNVDRYEPDVRKWGGTTLWSFDPAAEDWTKVETKNAPACMGLMEYAAEEDLLILFGGGTDGIADDGKTVRPSMSRLVQVCRVRVPGREVAPAPLPERVALETTADSVRLTWPPTQGATYDIFRTEAAPFPANYERIPGSPDAGGSFVDTTAKRGTIYAYQVARTDNANGRRSIPVFTQPFRPRMPWVGVVSAKETRLRWDASVEPDLVGYHVYRADGPEIDSGGAKRLTAKPIVESQFTDISVDLSDLVIRAYYVTAVNRFGVESGPSPLGHTVPEAPRGLTIIEGVSPSTGIGEKISWMLSWQWPEDVKVAGFNVYHATEHIDSYLHPGRYDAFWKLWTKLNDAPVTGTEYVFKIPENGPRNHYFYLRAMNVLGQEGFFTDIASPTDRQFRPAQP